MWKYFPVPTSLDDTAADEVTAASGPTAKAADETSKLPSNNFFIIFFPPNCNKYI